MVSFERFNMIIADILQECDRQDAKWGADRDHDPFTWLAILVEEVGELAQAVLNNYSVRSSIKNLRAEAIHVAAVAIQFIDCLDRNTWKYKS